MLFRCIKRKYKRIFYQKKGIIRIQLFLKIKKFQAENGNRDTRRGRLYNAGDPVLLLPSLFALTLARTLLTWSVSYTSSPTITIQSQSSSMKHVIQCSNKPVVYPIFCLLHAPVANINPTENWSDREWDSELGVMALFWNNHGAWYLCYMVTQNILLRKHEGKYLFSGEKIQFASLDRIKGLKQI